MLVCINLTIDIFLLYKAEKPSVRPSDRHVDNSVMPAWINAGLARHNRYVSRHPRVHF